MSHEKSRKTRPDVFCKLCFLPEGESKLVRVGKHKVQHEDCAAAWPKEDREKGREHVFMLQIAREEMAAQVEEAPEPEGVPVGPVSEEYVDFKLKQLGGADAEDQAASRP